MAIGENFRGFKPGIDATASKQPMMSVVPKESAPITKKPPVAMPKQPMMSYNIKLKNPSKKYVGLEKSEEEYVDSKLSEAGLTGDNLDIAKQDAVRVFAEVKQSKAFLKDRESTRQKIISGELSSGDKKQDDVTYRSSQFADMIRHGALSSGLKSILGVDDKTIIQKTLQQKPELQKTYDEFMKGNSDIIDVTMELKGQDKSEKKEQMGAFEKTVANAVRRLIGKDEKGSEERDRLIQDGKLDSFKKIAMDDFGAAPSVAIGAATVPAKQVANLMDYGAKKLAGIDLKRSDGVDKLVDKTGVKKDGWFQAGKIATELGLTAIETMAGMNAMNIGKLGALINKTPIISKYIAKPVLEAIGFTAAGDLEKGKASSLKTYGTNILTNVAFTSALEAVKSIRRGISLSKAEVKAAKNVDAERAQQIINETRALKGDIKANNPLENIESEVDDIVNKVNSDKGVVGEQIGKMRDTMKTISHSIDDSVDEINSSLKKNNIGVSIMKTSKGYKLSNKIVAGEGKTKVLNEIVSSLNEGASKSLGIKDKMAALDKLNQTIIYQLKSAPVETSLSNALGGVSKKFSTAIESAIEKYGFNKGKYSELINLKNDVAIFGSEKGDKATKLLSKILGGGTSRDAIKLLDKLKELGYTTRDLASEAFVTNKVMKEILSPSAFEQAMAGFYPSGPGAIMGGMTAAKSLIKKPVKRILESSKNFSELQAFKNRTIGGKPVDMGKWVGGTKGQKGKLIDTTKKMLIQKTNNKENDK